MIFAYSMAEEFCISTFCGNREIALSNGYKEVTEEMYAKLCNREAHWVNHELVERVKPQSEIDEEVRQRAEAERQKQITDLKAQLSASDYKAIKYAEGWITEEEYAPIKAERETIREQIRALDPEPNE